jgi:hypothetical protein
MSVQNLAIAGILEEVGDRLAIQRADPFRIRAYHSAARMLQELRADVNQKIARGDGHHQPCWQDRACRHLNAHQRHRMPWNSTYYPASMKNLLPVLREKAIEIANALLQEGMDEGKAIRIAIAKVEEWGRSHLAES